MSLSLADHEQKILDEILGSLESRARLAEGSQIFSFNLIKSFGLPYEQPDSGSGRKFLDAVQVSRGCHFCLLERFQVTVDGSFCSGVALFLDFFPKSETIVLSVLPTFEHIRGKIVKATLPASRRFLARVKGSASQPAPHRSFSQIK